MASNGNNGAPEHPVLHPWLETLARRRKETGIVLLAVSVLFTLVPVFVVYKLEANYLALSIWGTALAILFLGAGLWQLLHEATGRLSEVDATRLLILTLGGLTGLFTFVLLGLAMPYYQWWNTFSGGLETWRKNWWHLGVTAVALLGGLALIFASLQLARGDERTRPTLRRLLYGYNAALTGLLLVAILLVVNVLTYVKLPPFKYFGTPSDWTESSIFTLSSASQSILAHLDKPVKVYVLMPNNFLRQEVKNLMDNCMAATDKMQVEYVSPEDGRTISELARKYQILESLGILIVYGNEPKEDHEFIQYDDLAERGPTPQKFLFQGENAFIEKLNSLTEGKSRATVYFTQGSGELDLNDTDTGKEDRGMGVLKDRLQKGNYDVKELALDPTTTRVPEDAAVVVIARPSLPLPDNALKALRNYLMPASGDKKGKVFVLFDAVLDRNRSMVNTGLEKLLAEFNVQVGNDRILIFRNNRTRYPLQVPVVARPGSRNPVAGAFEGFPFFFTDVRIVQPASAGQSAMGSRYTADTIFQVPAGAVWAESNLQADPKQLVDSIQTAGDVKGMREKLSRKPLSVAVAVTEPQAPTPSDDPHAMMRQEAQPRMVVFGDATWVSNREMREGTNSGNYELFASVLSWLRERADIGKKADPKERKVYVINTDPEVLSRIWWLPAAVLLLGILSLGGGVWIVRRR
jgi:hypothetical protein